jgi:DNA-directed RNA polymerase specialized sigma24 family protein
MQPSNHARQQEHLNRLAEIYRMYAAELQRSIYNRVGDLALAEDLTSTVFLKALRWRRRGSEPRKCAWLALRDGPHDHCGLLADAESV